MKTRIGISARLCLALVLVASTCGCFTVTRTRFERTVAVTSDPPGAEVVQRGPATDEVITTPGRIVISYTVEDRTFNESLWIIPALSWALTGIGAGFIAGEIGDLGPRGVLLGSTLVPIFGTLAGATTIGMGYLDATDGPHIIDPRIELRARSQDGQDLVATLGLPGAEDEISFDFPHRRVVTRSAGQAGPAAQLLSARLEATQAARDRSFLQLTIGRTLLWTGVGLGSLGGISAFRYAAVADEVDAGTAKASERRFWSRLTWSFVGVGAPLIIAGATLWATTPDAPKDEDTHALTFGAMPTHHGALLGLGGSF